jgi:DNA helicase-2/ATP-dependent DNA helicase PcrA
VSLNPEQADAAGHGEGPALVLAGPGTGKTTTLVARFCRLVESGVSPASILSVTFTNKAAREMERRVHERLGRRGRSRSVKTFHAVCLGLLQEHGAAMGVPRAGVRVLDSRERFALLRKVAGPDIADVDDLADAIARFKDQLISPKEALDSARRAPAGSRQHLTAQALAYGRFQARLRDAGLLEFGDMIALVVQALRADDALRSSIASRFEFVMIDEYQDINRAQDVLVELLLHHHKNLWAVGDDDQAIYGWRGSDVGYIVEFKDRFPDARVIRLASNYRSRTPILVAAASLIRNNSRRLDKRLAATVQGETAIKILEARDEWGESDWIARAVKTLIDGGVRPAAIAILVRTKYLMIPIAAALRRAQIPHEIRPPINLWSQLSARLVVEVARHLSVPSRPLSLSLAYLEGPIGRLLNRSREQPFAWRLREVAALVASRAFSSMSGEKKIEWSEAAIQAAEEAASHPDLDSFLQSLEEPRRETSAARGSDGVVVSTIHQAKGLEWEAVFVAAMERGLLPHVRADDRQEERRLAYVAVTRARRYLTLSYALLRGDEVAAPSPFIAELAANVPPDQIERKRWPQPATRTNRARRRERVARAAAERPDVGARITHPRFGPGTIIDKGENDKLRVRFRDKVRWIVGRSLGAGDVNS